MSITQFSSVTGVGSLVNLKDATVGSSSTQPTTATAGLRFESDGELNYTANSQIPPDPVDQWYRAFPVAGVGADYEARLTVLSGDAPTLGPVNTWLSLSSLRVWSLTTAGVENLAGSWRVEIRSAVTTAVLGSADYAMSAGTGV